MVGLELYKESEAAFDQAGNTEAEKKDDLISLLGIASKEFYPDGGALTTREIIQKTGWSSKKVTVCLGNLKVAGKIEVVKVHREALDGRDAIVPAYRTVGVSPGD